MGDERINHTYFDGNFALRVAGPALFRTAFLIIFANARRAPLGPRRHGDPQI